MVYFKDISQALCPVTPTAKSTMRRRRSLMTRISKAKALTNYNTFTPPSFVSKNITLNTHRANNSCLMTAAIREDLS
jgi:hypothetical protein